MSKTHAGTRREWYFVQIVISALLVFTSLPCLYGYLSSPPDKQFLGLMLDVPDHAQYLSWFRGFQSSLFVVNKLTPEPNEPIFFNLLCSFLCILGYSHFMLAAAFIIGSFALLWYGHVHKQSRYAVGGGIVVLVLGWQHAYDLLIVCGVLAAFAGLVWLRARRFPNGRHLHMACPASDIYHQDQSHLESGVSAVRQRRAFHSHTLSFNHPLRPASQCSCADLGWPGAFVAEELL